MNLNFLISEFTDIYSNLALENSILRSNLDNYTLLLYVNRPCVVMGKFQNPYREIDFNYCRLNDIEIARRQSGGGCVYHDFGNINFSFIAPKKMYDKGIHQKILKDFFSIYGINVLIGERDEILVGNLKISGSAFKFIKDVKLHHFTLLVDSNLEHLNKALNSNLELQTKATKSVPSPTVNLLQKLDLSGVDQLLSKLKLYLSSIYNLTDMNTSRFIGESFEDYKDLISSKDFIFGSTPKFQFSYDSSILNSKVDCILEKGFLKSINTKQGLVDFEDFFGLDVSNITIYKKDFKDFILQRNNSLGCEFLDKAQKILVSYTG